MVKVEEGDGGLFECCSLLFYDHIYPYKINSAVHMHLASILPLSSGYMSPSMTRVISIQTYSTSLHHPQAAAFPTFRIHLHLMSISPQPGISPKNLAIPSDQFEVSK